MYDFVFGVARRDKTEGAREMSETEMIIYCTYGGIALYEIFSTRLQRTKAHARTNIAEKTRRNAKIHDSERQTRE